MGCNCNDISPCSRCSNGQPCNCPPDYTVLPVPSTCKCCPPGYQYTGITANYPNGQCDCITSNGLLNTACVSRIVAAIPCTSCEEAISTNCVTYVAGEGIPVNCFGIVNGDSLTTIINKMCLNLKSNVETILSTIGLDSDLQSGFCQLARICPPPSSGTVPVIGPIIITFP